MRLNRVHDGRRRQRPEDEPRVSLPSDASPSERLLLATLDEIEACGLGRATVRGIVKRAGMNVASVNYHFGSKEALVEAALARTIDNMWEDVSQLLDRVPEDAQTSLEGLAAFLLEGAQRYPNVSRAHLVPMLTADDYRGPFAEKLLALMARIEKELRSARGLPKVLAERRVRAFISAVFFPVMFPRLVDPARSLSKAAERTAFARELAAQLLSPER